MARFYGWSDVELDQLDIHTFLDYFESMERIKASELLDLYAMTSLPNWKEKQKARQLIDSLKDKINAGNVREIDPSDMQAILAR